MIDGLPADLSQNRSHGTGHTDRSAQPSSVLIGHRIRRVLPILAATGEVSTDRKLSPPLAAADQTLSSLRPP